jgi:hypothetical protein
MPNSAYYYYSPYTNQTQNTGNAGPQGVPSFYGKKTTPRTQYAPPQMQATQGVATGYGPNQQAQAAERASVMQWEQVRKAAEAEAARRRMYEEAQRREQERLFAISAAEKKQARLSEISQRGQDMAGQIAAQYGPQQMQAGAQPGWAMNYPPNQLQAGFPQAMYGLQTQIPFTGSYPGYRGDVPNNPALNYTGSYPGYQGIQSHELVQMTGRGVPGMAGWQLPEYDRFGNPAPEIKTWGFQKTKPPNMYPWMMQGYYMTPEQITQTRSRVEEYKANQPRYGETRYKNMWDAYAEHPWTLSMPWEYGVEEPAPTGGGGYGGGYSYPGGGGGGYSFPSYEPAKSSNQASRGYGGRQPAQSWYQNMLNWKIG